MHYSGKAPIKIGKELGMKEPYSERIANYTGLESCGCVGDDMAEALTEVRTGRVLSLVICQTWCRPAPGEGKAILDKPLSQGMSGPGGVKDPSHVRKLFARESGDPVVDSGRLGVRVENPQGAQP